MKARYLVLMVAAGFLLGITVQAKEPAKASSEAIGGVYVLYEFGDQSEKPQGNMTITPWKGETFLIHGIDWAGYGKLQGQKGYYDWKFDDGRAGRTDFEVNKDGTLKGRVHGSGIDWVYLARRAQ